MTQELELWPKDRHLARLRESGYFRFVREVLLHHVERGDAERFLELESSIAFGDQLQLAEQEIELERLRRAAFQYIGTELIPWYSSYRVRIGIK